MEKTVEIIIDASIRLKCTSESQTKALLIYHQFKRCVQNVEYDNHLLAAACLDISIKYNEEPIKWQTLIFVFYSILEQTVPKKVGDQKFNLLCFSVYYIECIVLRMIEFSLNRVLPFDYLKCMLLNIREPLVACNCFDSFNETCMKLICDLYLTNKCLKYTPDEIAASAVHAVSYIFGTDLSIEKYLMPWRNLFAKPSVSELINDIHSTIYTLNGNSW